MDSEKRDFLETAYKLFAFVVLLLLLAKCWIDIDSNWDTWAYHLPFAARLWQIIPETRYIFDPQIQQRFDGFPFLGEALQGFFWFVFRQVQATNLVAYFSLVAYIAFLQKCFRIPFYYSAIALLAIPLVQIHSSLSYVDLVGSIFVSAFVLLTYHLYTVAEGASGRIILLLFLTGACATNIKLLYSPVILLFGLIALYRIITLSLPQLQTTKDRVMWGVKALLICLAAILVFGMIPIKNMVRYHNPLHGIRIELGGRVISQGEDYTLDVPQYLRKAPEPLRWVLSLMEVNRPPLTWSHHQHYPEETTGRGHPADRMGGFFRDYVIIQLLLFVLLVCRLKSADAKKALLWMIVLSVITSFLPQGFQLRYTMYWMILLVSFNWILLYRYSAAWQKPTIIMPLSAAMVSLYVFLVVAGASHWSHILPQNRPLDILRGYIVKDSLTQVKAGATYCVSGANPYTLLFTSYFNPPHHYTIQDAGFDARLKVQISPGRCPKSMVP